MTQLVTRIDEDLAADLDRLVADGVVASRSDGVRRGLVGLIDQHRRSKIADSIVAGYRERPQTDGDIAWSDEATVRMIADEAW